MLTKIKSLQFTVMSPDEITLMSEAEVFDTKNIGPVRNSVNDLRFGPLDSHTKCETCHQTFTDCPGHFGHIELAEPVFHPKYFKVVYNILRCLCLNPSCYSPLITPEEATLLDITKSNKINRLTKLIDRCKNISVCEKCFMNTPIIRIENGLLVCKFEDGDKKVLSAKKVHEILSCLSDESVKLLGFNHNLNDNELYQKEDYFVCGETQHRHAMRPEWMIFTILPVLPSCVRPASVINGQVYPDDLTEKYISIVKCNEKLKSDNQATTIYTTKGRKKSGKMSVSERKKVYCDLENHIRALIDNSDETSKIGGGKMFRGGGRPHKGINERLKGKEGQVRRGIQSKRVDFTGRTVIGPDGNCDLNQILIPPSMAKTLTVPVVVRAFNFNFVQNLIRQGKINYVWPREGIKINLDHIRGGKTSYLLSKEAVERGDTIIVERQLQNDDWVIFNRQPTLRVESMLGMRVKVVEGKTIRFSLAATTPLNADFDGDECNLHAPQTYEAIAEIKTVMNTNNRIRTPQRNGVIIGIIQDGLVGSYLLTQRGVMVEWGIAFDAMFSSNFEEWDSFFDRAEEYFPETIKDGKIVGEKCPGKLLFSTLLPHDLFYTLKNNIDSQEPTVIIEHGILIEGVIDKKIIGGRSHSIIDVLSKSFSCDQAATFINRLHRLINRWFPTRGFSVGIGDCDTVVWNEIQSEMEKMSVKCHALIEESCGDKRIENEIKTELASATNIGQKLSKNGLVGGDDNPFIVMMKSGGKGNHINCAQINAIVGQQIIRGERAPMIMTNNTRTLPSFECHDISPEARGFVKTPYVIGLNPQETFFHAMSGREGVIDTACKSVTRQTELMIIENNNFKRVMIGDWIDELMSDGDVIKDKDREMMKLFDPTFIPTTDMKGNVSWGEVTHITRHDPTEVMYKITTLSGRSVSVTSSHSLLVWNNTNQTLERKNPKDVIIGNHVPVTFKNKDKLPCVDITTLSHNFEKINDIILDPISEIEIIKTSSKVYDLTVPSTLNFGLANGLHVVDTAETGYLQRKIGKKLENLSVQSDGSVRDGNGFLFEYLYGGDGMDGAQLCFPHNSHHPFFVDLYTLSHKLNQESILEPDYLSNYQIEEVCEMLYLHHERFNPNDLVTTQSNHLKNELRKQLKKIRVCEDCFELLKQSIFESWCDTLVNDGEVVGLIAASSLGEPITQQSVVGSEKLIFVKDGIVKIDTFSSFIDEVCNNHNNDVCKVDGIKVLAVSKDEKIRWRELKCVSRHPSNGQLIKVTTKTNKTVIATLSHSFLNKHIEPVLGSELKIGDIIPTFDNIPKLDESVFVGFDEIIKLEILEDPHEYVYDLTVDQDHTFATMGGIMVHNTLNTFHMAGVMEKDVTLGVPRIKELTSCSKKPKTPGCLIKVNDERLNEDIPETDKLEIVRKIGVKIEYLTLSKLLEKEMVVWKVGNPPTSPVLDQLNLNFYDQYSPEWWIKLNEEINCDSCWVIGLYLSVEKLWYYNITLDEIADCLETFDGGVIRCITSPLCLGRIDLYFNFDGVIESVLKLARTDDLVTSENAPYFYIRDIVLKKLGDIHLRGIKGIERVFPTKTEDGWKIDTQGCNFLDVLALKEVISNETVCDHMWEIYSTLGIEATRNFLIEELGKVLGFDGTYVNPRHIKLLVNAITRKGTITNIDRHGIDRSMGPLAKVSFERTLDNFVEASTFTECDNLNSVSAMIATGKLTDVGAGRVMIK